MISTHPQRMLMLLSAALITLCVAAGTAAQAADPSTDPANTIWVGRFDTPGAANGLPAPWQIQPVSKSIPPTNYRLRDWDGVPAIEAHAVKSMALLARTVEVDLAKTPVLCWRWRIEAPLKNANMTRKEGDDYAARVYLSFSVPPETLSLGTRLALGLARSLHGDLIPDAAINYIWDNRHPVGTWQANAYTERTQMLVLRSGAGEAGRWVNERRLISADFQRAFGHAPTRLTGVAIATDTDNTGEEAHAGFADVRFVARENDCPEPNP